MPGPGTQAEPGLRLRVRSRPGIATTRRDMPFGAGSSNSPQFRSLSSKPARARAGLSRGPGVTVTRTHWHATDCKAVLGT
jgi:hypothetical protein